MIFKNDLTLLTANIEDILFTVHLLEDVYNGSFLISIENTFFIYVLKSYEMPLLYSIIIIFPPPEPCTVCFVKSVFDRFRHVQFFFFITIQSRLEIRWPISNTGLSHRMRPKRIVNRIWKGVGELRSTRRTKRRGIKPFLIQWPSPVARPKKVGPAEPSRHFECYWNPLDILGRCTRDWSPAGARPQ